MDINNNNSSSSHSNGHSNSDDHCMISPLTENLSSSYVDPNKLISFDLGDQPPVGMANFKSKSKLSKSNLGSKSATKLSDLVPNERQALARQRWKTAALKLKLVKDPWYEFRIDSYPVETVIRHRYNPIKKEWKKDECLVKMENKQFANGAMRACFRLKKLSNFSHHKSWDHASNYVAKSYKSDEIPRERYFEDVKLQMDAKLWAELYNKHKPPKKIDMFQVSILEFANRPDSPLFHLEHYIEGTYVKYNSNAGFVEDIHVRNTPHAFSHFTFECSSHELIVVDIQGVGDLYTDPQIHTAKGDDYGDGNLGVKGFALFFHSHICNDICKSLGLTQFDLSPNELAIQNKTLGCMKKSNMTRSRGKEEPVFSQSWSARTRYLLNRLNLSEENGNTTELNEADEFDGYCSSPSPSYSSFTSFNLAHHMAVPPCTMTNHNNSCGNLNMGSISYSKHSLLSNNSNNTSIMSSPFQTDDAYRFFTSNAYNKPRPSAVLAEKDAILNGDTEYRCNTVDFGSYDSILGKAHLEMCKYHEFGRFLINENDEFDSESAFFHLQQAANLGVTEALINIGKIYLQLPHDVLPEYHVEENDNNFDIGFDYMVEAAEKGDKYSLYYVAKAFDTGIGLSKNKSTDWSRAMEYYRKILSDISEDKNLEDAGYCDISTDCDAPYIILARMGEIYMQGGNGVETNYHEAADLFNEAAERAIEYGKGRLANKYYNLAETANSQT